MTVNPRYQKKHHTLIAITTTLISCSLLAACGTNSNSSATPANNAKAAKVDVEVQIVSNPPLPNATPVILRMQGNDPSNKDVDIFKVLPINYVDIRKQFDAAENKNAVVRTPTIRIKLDPLFIEELAKKPGTYTYNILPPINPDGSVSASSDNGIFNNSGDNGIQKVNFAFTATNIIGEQTDQQASTMRFLEAAVANKNKDSDTEKIKQIKAVVEKRFNFQKEFSNKFAQLEKDKNNYAVDGVIRIIDSPKTAARWLKLSDEQAVAYMETLHKIIPNATQIPHVVFEMNTTFEGIDAVSGAKTALNTNWTKGAILLPPTIDTKYVNQTVAIVLPKKTDSTKWYSDKRLKNGIPVLNQYKLYVINETAQEVDSPKQ